MAKFSIGDKLKTIFSKEKGKDIADYVYKSVIVPTAKNTLFTVIQVSAAKFCDIDVSNIPTLPNSNTAYSKVGTVSDKKLPDKPSYLMTQMVHGDINSIPFEQPKEAHDLASWIVDRIQNGVTRKCSLADVYEHLKMPQEIRQGDYDQGWSAAHGIQGIGIRQIGNLYYVQAPGPRRIT